MKILHVINSLNTGGAEKLLLDTLPAYRAHGLEVDLAVLVDDNYPFMERLKSKFDGRIFILGQGSVYNPKAILPLAKLMKNYDIVHTHLFPVQYFAVISNKLNRNRSKLIYTEHNTTNRRMGIKLYSPLEKIVYKSYDKIVCISSEIEDIVNNYISLEKGKTIIIHNGVNLQEINNAEKLERNSISSELLSEDKLLIQVAGFREQKDQDTVIKTLVHLPESFKLLLVGDGERINLCKKLAKNIGVEDRVIFLGKRSDVPRLLKSADYVILSSHYEGLSLSSIEGMASGKPFIASDVPGLREVVKGYGKLFEDGNVEQLTNIILQLDKHKADYNNVVDRCLERSKEFDLKLMVDKHIKLYEEFES